MIAWWHRSSCLQAPKKSKADLDEDDKAFLEKKKAEQAALKEAQAKGLSDLHFLADLLLTALLQLRRVRVCSRGCRNPHHGLLGGAPGGGIKKLASPSITQCIC